MSDPIPVRGIEDILDSLASVEPQIVPLEHYSRPFEIFETKRVTLARDIEVRGEVYKKGETAYLTLTHRRDDFVLLPWEKAYHTLSLVDGTPIEGRDFEFRV